MVWVDNATPEVDALSEWRTIVTICSILSAFSIAIVSARLYIRHKNHGLAADDWMSALSMVFALIYSIMTIVRTCMFLAVLGFFVFSLSHCNRLLTCLLSLVQRPSLASDSRSWHAQRRTSSRTRAPTMPAGPSTSWASASSRLRC